MYQNPSQRAYAQAQGTVPTNGNVIADRDPNANDIYYPIGQFWLNQPAKNLWYLDTQSNVITPSNPSGTLQSTWQLISVSSVLASLSDTANDVVFPTSSSAVPPDNIQLIGGSGITVVSNPSSNSITFTNTAAGAETLTGDDGIVVSPSGGTIQLLGNTVANSTHTKPVFTSSPSGNIEDINVQVSAAIASTNINKAGLSSFNSSQFGVDANGFVTLSGGTTAPVLSLTPNSGTSPVDPISGTINVLGTGSLTTVGTSGTVTVELTGLTNHAVLVGNGSTTITNVGPNATSGIPLISQGSLSDPAFGTAVVAGGGTGDTSFTPFAVITGGTTSTGALQNVSGLGTSGQVLTSNGTGALPTWQNTSTTGIVTLAGDTGSATGSTVTISGSTTGLTTSASASTMNLAGTLNVSHGGTGDTSFTAFSVITGGTTTTGALQSVSTIGAVAGQVLTFVGTSSLPTWQSISASGAVVGLTVDATTGGGTNPVLPNGSGDITLTGGPTFSSGTRANPIEVVSTAANTASLEIQLAGSNASTPAANNFGVAQFNSTNFGVSAGFVSSNNFTINTGAGLSGGGSITLGGSLTLTATGSTTFTYTNVNHAASPYAVKLTDQYLSVDCSAGTVQLNFPNAPPTFQYWIIKDRTGNASTNNISVTTVGGVVTIDGQTTYTIASNYSSIYVLFNGTSYEVF